MESSLEYLIQIFEEDNYQKIKFLQDKIIHEPISLHKLLEF